MKQGYFECWNDTFLHITHFINEKYHGVKGDKNYFITTAENKPFYRYGEFYINDDDLSALLTK